jgi:sulfur carrier protein
MIRVNDKWDIPWRPGMTVKDLLDACGFTHHYILITVNGTLVPPEDYAAQAVADGDQVRVVHVLAGG